LTEVELVTDVVAAGCDAVFVTVSVLAGVVTVWALVVVVVVTVSDLAGTVVVFAWAAAPEMSLAAPCAALETAPFVEPDPHALSCAVATQSASALKTSGIR
jgi:hypothetical protein